MSIVQTVAGVANRPEELIVSVSINGYSDFYTDYSAGENLRAFDGYTHLVNKFQDNLSAQQFLSRYDDDDVYTANLNRDSDSLWMITATDLHRT